MPNDNYVTRQNKRYSQFSDIRHLFFESLCAAEQHWFFIQGHDAYVNELYVPALSSLLNGIEATLRVTLHLLHKEPSDDIRDISPYRVLSNTLINQVKDAGLPVQYLAFNDETDFLDRLSSVKPNRADVRIVQLRNNICHGNVMEFVNVELGPENAFFTPECLRPVTEQVLAISADWCEMLGRFRRQNGVNHYDRPDKDQMERDLRLYDFMNSNAKDEPNNGS